MPVDFLTNDQKEGYGRFSYDPDDAELAACFHLDDSDLALINSHRGTVNRLGFALQLTTVRFLGTFLTDPTDVPENVVEFIAAQLSINDASCLVDYRKRKQTPYGHVNEIKAHHGYSDFNEPPWRFRLARVLYSRFWIGNDRPSLLFEFSIAWLMQRKVLLPGVTTLSRLIAEVRERATTRLWSSLAALPNNVQKAQLESLLEVSEGHRNSLFDDYRKGPVRVSGPEFNKTIQRHLGLAKFGIHELNISKIPPVRLKALARHSQIVSSYKIARMPEHRRIALLIAFVRAATTSLLDDALDILDLLITDIASSAKNAGKRSRLRNLKDLDKSAISLAKVCALIIDDGTHDNDLRKRIFKMVPKESLVNSIDTITRLARPSNEQMLTEMVNQYSRVKSILPALFTHINFEAAPAGRSTMDAINYIVDVIGSRKSILDDAPVAIVTKPWERLVFDEAGRVNRKGYVLCLLEKLQDALRRRDIYVPESHLWSDPRAKLLSGNEWRSSRTQVCRSLGHSMTPDQAITQLADQLDRSYKETVDNFTNNEAVRLDHSGKRITLTIKNLDELPEAPSLVALRAEVASLLPTVDLTELLLEIDTHTEFTQEFFHVSEANARAENLAVSICAALIAEACNIGLEPLIKPHVPALTRHRLSWVKQNYLRAETLIAANTRLVDYQSTLKLARAWGGGEVASADGMRFVAPVRTLNARANKKYFGASRGITWYNFLSNQYSGFHGIVVPGTLRDSIYVLEGLLEQQTGLRPKEIMTDTSGSSDLVFGLFWLLGYQFSPRLADAGEATFWRIDSEADYGAFNELACSKIKLNKITPHWDDMLRIAGSLKLGTVHASELIRSLLRSTRPSGLTQAIIELGRINKTCYLLNYISDEEYRRRILTQLNKGESRHFVARAICFGQRGEIRKHYREGQEDQLGALGLVTNAVILWNTLYMQAALDCIEERGSTINQEDISRLSPLRHEHINMFGRYSFTLDETVDRGVLRPLNLDLDAKNGHP